MDDLSVHLKTVAKYTLIFIFICAISALFVQPYQHYILGFALGAAAGLINAYYLSAKIVQLTQQAEAAEAHSTRPVRSQLGFLTRASVAVLAVLFALKNDYFEVSAAILGLIIVPMFALFIGYITVRKNNNT